MFTKILNGQLQVLCTIYSLQLRVRVRVIHKVSHPLYMHVAMYQYVKYNLLYSYIATYLVKI